MPNRTLPELKSANHAAFDHYLRTGERLTSEEWLGRQELKFGGGNPYHDELGRFTSASSAVSPRGEAGFAGAVNKVREWFGNAPKKPAPAKPKPAPMARASQSPSINRTPDAVAKGQRDIGALAAKYEARKLQGPGTISSGRGDPGGVSYGAFQMNSNGQVVQDFVKSPEASAWAGRFRGKAPVTKPFDDEWRAIAAADPVGFESAQRAYIVRANYSPGAATVRRNARYELDQASPAVRQAFFATAVQHGASGGGGLLVKAVQAVDARMKRSDPRYEPALINALYDYRTEQRRTFARNARAKAAELIRRNRRGEANALIRNAGLADNDVNRRYPRERYDALLLLSHQPMSNL